MRNFLMIIVTVAVVLSACEKDISVDPQQGEASLVVEGRFESNQYPQVVLTRSLSYFTKVDPAALVNSFVHNAQVIVSDSSRSMTLKEAIVQIPGIGAVFAYIPDTTRPSAVFKGKTGSRYTLKITADNKSYESVTTIPLHAFHLDSIWSQRVKIKDDTLKARLWARITDAATPGNYARYFTRRNREPFLAGANSTFDDQVVNGTTFEIPLDAGIDKIKRVDPETYGYFNGGDTVTVKFCNVDKATFSFWRALDFAYNSNGNPFASPTKIIGNVPGALGYWGGYAVAYKRIIIRK
ncbi:DUF4249 domain-containing protein [Chitinophaga qingshengii]|uniref:DUF4249 domain-containing protein n=1 Tax=Chitinophaga qingshengii TaxID=1569794 RepID=A0ABR7TN46_9BACT|nr:DUF4249 domain-containing protein [Chitinophaga qingshengii]MBC9931909.1 DUF4249 domain-containing protein [Chitinophaga qingshengii]